MPAPRKYPPELRERAVRLVLDAREQEPELSLNAAVMRIGPRVGINRDTLREPLERRVSPVVHVSVPDPRGGSPRSQLIRTYTDHKDEKRGLKRAALDPHDLPDDERYEACGYREDSENQNNIFDTTLPLRRARSYGAKKIKVRPAGSRVRD